LIFWTTTKGSNSTAPKCTTLSRRPRS